MNVPKILIYKIDNDVMIRACDPVHILFLESVTYKHRSQEYIFGNMFGHIWQYILVQFFFLPSL